MSGRGARKAAALLVAIAWPCGIVLAQSLGELAEDAKKKRKGGAPVYSDENLKQRQPASSPAPVAPTAAAVPVTRGGGSSESRGGGGGDGSVGGGGDGEGEEGRSGGRRNDEGNWRQEAAQHRARIKEAKLGIEAAQQRLNALMSDLVPTNVGDPFREQNLEAERAKARAELADAERNLERVEDAFHEFEEEARRKSIPPGWLEER
jgi:hypothetical protein